MPGGVAESDLAVCLGHFYRKESTGETSLADDPLPPPPPYQQSLMKASQGFLERVRGSSQWSIFVPL